MVAIVELKFNLIRGIIFYLCHLKRYGFTKLFIENVTLKVSANGISLFLTWFECIRKHLRDTLTNARSLNFYSSILHSYILPYKITSTQPICTDQLDFVLLTPIVCPQVSWTATCPMVVTWHRMPSTHSQPGRQPLL